MALLDDVKAILVEELEAKGYRPNMADVQPAAVRIVQLIEEHMAKAANVAAAVQAASDKAAAAKSVPAAPGAPVAPTV